MVSEVGSRSAGCALSVCHPLVPFSLAPLPPSVSDACRCRGAWWGEIVNDASHGKSGSPGHATPSPVSFSSMGLYLRNPMSHNQRCTYRNRLAIRLTGIIADGVSPRRFTLDCIAQCPITRDTYSPAKRRCCRPCTVYRITLPLPTNLNHLPLSEELVQR